jgi:hypothetical protein
MMSKSDIKTIKVDPALYSAFKSKCKASNMSVCEVLESFFKKFNTS